MSTPRKLLLALFYAIALPIMVSVALVWIFAGLVWTILRSEQP